MLGNKLVYGQIFYNVVGPAFRKKTPVLRVLSLSSSLQSPATPVEFNNKKFQEYLETLRKEFYDLRNNAGANDITYARMTQLKGVVSALEQYRVLKSNLATKDDLENEKDEDMRQLIEEENNVYGALMRKTESEIMKEMLNLTDDSQYPSLIFEINAGAGGQEAMLFAKVLYNMYINLFDIHNWKYEVLDEDVSVIGGLRHVNLIVEGKQAYTMLQYEAGVHRVQRVPVTEKSGRMHTSTASVSVIPRPADVHVKIAEKDLKVETKRASGAGGQHVNTTDSAVRIVHLPTGIAVECQAERSQLKNRETALKKLQSKLIQRELEIVEAQTRATRRSQQGNLNRNEKIRTYNFVQDRVTDHRFQGSTVHNLKEFLSGGELLISLIQRLVIENRKIKLAQILENWNPERSK